MIERLFSSDLREVFSTIKFIFSTYDKIEKIDIDLLKEVYLQKHPALTVPQKKLFSTLIDDIKHETDIDNTLAADYIRTIWRREQARLISEKSIEILNGEKDTLDEIVSIVSGLANKQDQDIIKPYKEIPYDLESILSETDPSSLFPFRLNSISKVIPGAGRGNFAIVFARPESGKTTYMVYSAAGYLEQGLKVHYFMNEEPAHRVYLRLVCSKLELSEEAIRANVKEAQAAFKPYAELLKMNDAVGMDISMLDAYCLKNKPDVLILDQLDKFHIGGDYARGDERLGALYVAARELAKKHSCLVYGVSQASADAEGIRELSYDMLAGSKTSKAAEADVIIGIGKPPSVDENDPIRHFCISKNKINGFRGTITANLDHRKAIFSV